MSTKKKRHRIESVTEDKKITRTVCRHPGCKFRNKTAAQGVCYSNKGKLVEWAPLIKRERELGAELRAMKRREGKGYAFALESHYVSAMMNWEIALDEVVRLRGENARLRLLKRARSSR